MKVNPIGFFRSAKGRITLLSLLPLTASFLFALFILRQKNRITETLSEEKFDGVTETLQWLWIGSVVFVVVIFLLLVTVGLLFYSKFKKTVEVPLAQLSRMADGDLKEEKIVTHDEAGALVGAANRIAQNLQKASSFTKHIGEGKFDEDFKPVSDHDILGNSLVQMRDKLKVIAEDDHRRNWVTKGLARFGDLLRTSTDYHELTDRIVTELVKYTHANQGGLFVLNSDDEHNPYLELAACYAYDRKKHIEKRVNVGEGLVGQCYLEREIIFLREIPQGYLHITSGLGEALPTCLLIVPMMVNEVVEGVVEIGSFRVFEQHEIDFVKKIGEQIASVLAAVKVNERTKNLLEQSQQQAEEMRAQEEEMRQNMEELQATQEHLQRQSEEMKRIQKSLELEMSMFHVLLEYLPDRITYKDTESRILRINKAKAKRLDMRAEEVIGKTDYDFFPPEHAEKAMREERELIRIGKPLLDIEERTFLKGDMVWASTSRIPFKNERNEIVGMFIITRDIKQHKLAEMALRDEEKIMQIVFKNFPLIKYKINKDGNLHGVQKGNLNGMLSDFDLEGLHLSRFSEKLMQTVSRRQEDVVGDNILHKGHSIPCVHYTLQDSTYPDEMVGMTLVQLD